MNFIDEFFLRLALLPAFLYDRLKIDRRQLRAILTAKLTMDNRRQSALGGGKKKTVSSASLTMMLSQLFLGLILLITLAIAEDMATKLSFFMALFNLMVCFTLISDFTSVLIDTRDNLIILPKPVSDATFTTGRLLHIAIRIAIIVIPLAAPGCIAAAVMRGALVVPPFILMIMLATLLDIFLINAVYLLILKITTPAKFQSIIGYIQIIFMIFLMVSGQIVPRMIGESILLGVSVKEIPFFRFMPPFWFADACVMLSGGGYTAGSIISLALAVSVPLLSLWIVVKFFAPSFNQKLGMITGGVSEQSGGKTASLPAAASRKKSFLQHIAGWITASGAERAGFLFTARMISRSRDFKMKVYPSCGSMLVIIVLLLQRPVSDGIALTDPRLLPMLLTSIYMCCLPLGTAFMYAAYSDRFRASWIFSVAPLEKPGAIISGAAKYLIVLFICPFMIPLTLLGLVLFRFQALVNLILGAVNLLVIASFLTLLFFRKLPFTADPETVSKGNALIQTFLFMVILGIIGAAHWLLSGFPWVVGCLWIVLSALVIRLSWKKIKDRNCCLGSAE